MEITEQIAAHTQDFLTLSPQTDHSKKIWNLKGLQQPQSPTDISWHTAPSALCSKNQKWDDDSSTKILPDGTQNIKHESYAAATDTSWNTATCKIPVNLKFGQLNVLLVDAMLKNLIMA